MSCPGTEKGKVSPLATTVKRALQIFLFLSYKKQLQGILRKMTRAWGAIVFSSFYCVVIETSALYRVQYLMSLQGDMIFSDLIPAIRKQKSLFIRDTKKLPYKYLLRIFSRIQQKIWASLFDNIYII